MAVIDPSNLIQNALNAARALQQINNQVTQITNQIRQLENDARNLTSLGRHVRAGHHGQTSRAGRAASMRRAALRSR